jgi:dTDP-4-dehydrorhamnose reductase
MKWLITGGSGQLALTLSSFLEKYETTFLAPNRDILDVTSPRSIESVVNEFDPDVIVNCAAWTDVDGAELCVDQTFEVNAIGAANMAKAARDSGVRFIHISTDFVFGVD